MAGWVSRIVGAGWGGKGREVRRVLLLLLLLLLVLSERMVL